MSSFWTDKRVLVTGGTGFLGRAVCRLLNQAQPTLLAAPASADYDLRNAETTQRLLADVGADVVIHLAARVGGIGANQEQPASLYLDNLLMGTNVIEQCRRAGTDRLVVVGTVCSYPKHTRVPFSEDSLWTGYPEETNAPYGVAKLAQLVQLQANRHQYGQQGIYLMPTNLYGPGDKFHPSVSHVIPALIKRCVDAVEAGEDSIEVWGTGTASREFLYVDDAARGILLATEHYRGADPVNLGSNQEIPIKELVEDIADVTGFSGRILWDSTRPDGQPRRCVDPARARVLFGFEATTPFAEGLRRTYDWYVANRQEAESRGRSTTESPSAPTTSSTSAPSMDATGTVTGRGSR
ncbi:GDP-L-fucose synthase family protein [Candidatus Poriferisocius sp.]|uniref:GDP-L-fucose synthase family protein n=1 Tax=Candidatus Poriferisocius sp. TaxID=3101276 RepID=UPI003B5B6FAF